MKAKKEVDEIYSEYSMQIDTILSIMDNNYRAAARIVAWLYKGSPETWRKFLAKKKTKKAIPKEVKDLLSKMKKQR